MVASFHCAGVQARECHWNVTGQNFGPLHALFGDAYDELAGWEDVIAERVRALGAKVPATLDRFQSDSKIAPKALFGATPADMVRGVLSSYTTLATCIKQALDTFEEEDCITANILQDIGAKVDKRAWMLRMNITG